MPEMVFWVTHSYLQKKQYFDFKKSLMKYLSPSSKAKSMFARSLEQHNLTNDLEGSGRFWKVYTDGPTDIVRYNLSIFGNYPMRTNIIDG